MVAPWNTAWGASAVSSGHDPTEKGLASLNILGSPQPLCQVQGVGGSFCSGPSAAGGMMC